MRRTSEALSGLVTDRASGPILISTSKTGRLAESIVAKMVYVGVRSGCCA